MSNDFQFVPKSKIMKVDPSIGLVMGWAIICKVDGVDYYDLNVEKNEKTGEWERVPEHIPEDAMLKAAMDFMRSSRLGNEMHRGPDKGEYVFAWPMSEDIAKAMGVTTKQTGLMVGFFPPPDVFAKYQSGELKGFSIEGNRVKWDDHH